MLRRVSEFWSCDQRPQESVDEFYSDMMCKAQDFNATDDMTCYAIMRGMKPELCTYAMQQNLSPYLGNFDFCTLHVQSAPSFEHLNFNETVD